MKVQETKKKDTTVVTEAVYEEMHTKFEAYTGDEPYLFVSYSHKDTSVIYPILDKLYDRRYRIWYDESCETGNDFRDELRTRIERCEAVLLFVSEASMNSPFCGMEIIVARENNKRIYPVYLDNSEVPPAFQILLANTHHAVVTDEEKMLKSLVRDLPAVAMDRLTKTPEGDKVLKCEDNGKMIQVDEGVREIQEDAFRNRKSLEKIELPETLEKIGEEAFRGCSKLTAMVIPERTVRIGESAFRDCISMKSLIIRNNRIKIGERAFENCSTLETVELPDGLRELYGGVFNSCKSLKRIKLPEHLTLLGESAFSDCIGLEEIDVPESVFKIDDLVFNGCLHLAKIELHEGLRKIGKAAFKNCQALTKILLPTTVSSISEAPFRGCTSLKSIEVEKKNMHYKSEPNKRDGKDHVLFNKNKSVLIAYPANSREVQYDIPDSVVCINDWAFSDCKKLNRVTIPDSVQEIGEGAFGNCALLDEIEIPDSVTKLDDCAFSGCKKLEKIIIPSSVREFGWGIFDGCDEDGVELTVYCDEGSAAYEYCIANGIKQDRIDKGDLE